MGRELCNLGTQIHKKGDASNDDVLRQLQSIRKESIPNFRATDDVLHAHLESGMTVNLARQREFCIPLKCYDRMVQLSWEMLFSGPPIVKAGEAMRGTVYREGKHVVTSP
jgi:hypothetical protein